MIVLLFLHNRKFHRNFLLCKKLSEGCTARGREVCLAAPLARKVCACTHFFIVKLENKGNDPVLTINELFDILL